MSWFGIVAVVVLGAASWRLLSEYGARPGEPMAGRPRAVVLSTAVGVGFATVVLAAGWGAEALLVAGGYLVCRLVWLVTQERRSR